MPASSPLPSAALLVIAARAPLGLLARAGRPALRPLNRSLDHWAVGAQQQARRNAMVAATALAQRRAEHAEVEEYLAGAPATPAVPAPRAAWEPAGPGVAARHGVVADG